MDIKKYFETTKIENVLSKRLTKREIQVLGLYASGFSVKEIAEILYIAQCTVKTHINSVRMKINIFDRINLRITLCLFWHTYGRELNKTGNYKICK